MIKDERNLIFNYFFILNLISKRIRMRKLIPFYNNIFFSIIYLLNMLMNK